MKEEWIVNEQWMNYMSELQMNYKWIVNQL